MVKLDKLDKKYCINPTTPFYVSRIKTTTKINKKPLIKIFVMKLAWLSRLIRDLI